MYQQSLAVKSTTFMVATPEDLQKLKDALTSCVSFLYKSWMSDYEKRIKCTRKLQGISK